MKPIQPAPQTSISPWALPMLLLGGVAIALAALFIPERGDGLGGIWAIWLVLGSIAVALASSLLVRILLWSGFMERAEWQRWHVYYWLAKLSILLATLLLLAGAAAEYLLTGQATFCMHGLVVVVVGFTTYSAIGETLRNIAAIADGRRRRMRIL